MIDILSAYTQARSQPSTSILIKTPNIKPIRKSCFLLADLVLPSEDGLEAGATTFQRQIMPPVELDSSIYMLDFVHGLVCFENKDTRCFQIYNPSTGETTPWIKSLVKQQQEDEKQVVSEDGSMVYIRAYLNFRWSYFGYDPATKQHKILSLWRIHTSDESGNCISDEIICEVLTVGGKQQQNSFRKVDVVLPLVSPGCLGKSVYVNGYIFWYHGDMDVIVEFNCGTEKFRVISIPDGIADLKRFCTPYLTEVGGRLALLAKKSGQFLETGYTEYWEMHNTCMRMYLLRDNGNQDYKKTNETTQSSHSDWVQEEFSMPPFEWRPDRTDSILSIPGTDFFVVRSATIKDDFSFYYYNWKEKKYSSNKVEIDGISSFLVPSDGIPLYHHGFYFYTTTENLLPVNELLCSVA